MSAHTTGTIARLLGAELIGRDDLAISGVDGLDRAREGTLTFIRSRAYGRQWARSNASAAIITRGIEIEGHDPARRALLVVDDADVAMLHLLTVVAPPEHRPPVGVHPTAIVHPGAKVDPSVSVGPLCIVGAGTVVGEGTVLMSRVTLGQGVTIGGASVLHAGVVIQDRCVVGSNCLLHPGVVIGADGFGFAPAPDGRGSMKIPHIGDVRIGDDVEIGANSCVDRAKVGSTTIGSGTKIDNLVQIGHGVQVGRACLICGQCGIAGSVVIGDGARLGGQVGVSDNITIYPRTKIAAQTGVNQQPEGPGDLMGYPARPARQTARLWALLDRLAGLVTRVRHLEKHTGVSAAPQDAIGDTGARA